VSDLLEIAYAGCFNSDCVLPVTTIQSEYQTLMYEAVDVSYEGIKTTIEVMRFMKAAVRESTKGPRGRGNAKKILKATIPWVNKLSKGYETLEQKTEVLMNKADAASLDATKNNLALKRQWDQWKKEVDATTAEMEGNKARDIVLKGMVDRQIKSLKNIEQQRNTLAVEFVRLARTNVRTHEKCDVTVLQNYKTVTNYIKKTAVYNKGSTWYGRNKGQGTTTTTDEVKEAVRISDTMKKRCWTQKDKTHLDELEKKMNLINEQINATRPGYLTLMKQLHETQRDRSSMASMIAKAVTEQGQFNAAQGDHTNALKGLNTASTSLKMVKTIFLESAKFWKRQKQFIIDYLRAPAGATKTGDNSVPISSGPIIANIIGTRDNKVWRDTMIETGMYWIVFGRLSSMGYVTMNEAKNAINRVYVSQMDNESRQRILGKAQDVMDKIEAFRANLELVEKAKDSEMDEALKSIYQQLGEDPNFERLVPLVTTTVAPLK